LVKAFTPILKGDPHGIFPPHNPQKGFSPNGTQRRIGILKGFFLFPQKREFGSSRRVD